MLEAKKNAEFYPIWWCSYCVVGHSAGPRPETERIERDCLGCGRQREVWIATPDLEETDG